MILGICKLELFLPEVHSLKEKRQIIRKILGKTKERFDLSISEVDHQELWQRAGIGFAVVGSERALMTSLVDEIIRSIESLDVAPITDRTIDVMDF